MSGSNLIRSPHTSHSTRERELRSHHPRVRFTSERTGPGSSLTLPVLGNDWTLPVYLYTVIPQETRGRTVDSRIH